MSSSQAITVRVTRECIKKGKRWTLDKCPVALALKNAGVPNPIVSQRCWRVDGDAIFHRLPTEVCRFITRFDCQKPVKPITFKTSIPRPAKAARSKV